MRDMKSYRKLSEQQSKDRNSDEQIMDKIIPPFTQMTRAIQIDGLN